MTIKSDRWIIQQCRDNGMIDPYVDHSVREEDGRKVISYGVSAYGYDIRVANEFKLLNSTFEGEIDPKKEWVDQYKEFQSIFVLIPPNSMLLCRSVEYFRIPRDVIGICLGKSTYSRCGIVCNVTPLEPGWEGYLTIELSNTTPRPVKIYAGEGIAQLVFHQSDEQCITSYADKGGKYMKQVGVTGAKM